MCINKASAIDLILVSDPEKVCQSGVICVGISDHLLTYCTRKVTRAYVNKHKTIRIRSSKNYSQEQFIHNLNETDWTDVLKDRPTRRVPKPCTMTCNAHNSVNSDSI